MSTVMCVPVLHSVKPQHQSHSQYSVHKVSNVPVLHSVKPQHQSQSVLCAQCQQWCVCWFFTPFKAQHLGHSQYFVDKVNSVLVFLSVQTTASGSQAAEAGDFLMSARSCSSSQWTQRWKPHISTTIKHTKHHHDNSTFASLKTHQHDQSANTPHSITTTPQCFPQNIVPKQLQWTGYWKSRHTDSPPPKHNIPYTHLRTQAFCLSFSHIFWNPGKMWKKYRTNHLKGLIKKRRQYRQNVLCWL